MVVVLPEEEVPGHLACVGETRLCHLRPHRVDDGGLLLIAEEMRYGARHDELDHEHQEILRG